MVVVVCEHRKAVSGLRDQEAPAKSTSLAEVKENRCRERWVSGNRKVGPGKGMTEKRQTEIRVF